MFSNMTTKCKHDFEIIYNISRKKSMEMPKYGNIYYKQEGLVYNHSEMLGFPLILCLDNFQDQNHTCTMFIR